MRYDKDRRVFVFEIEDDEGVEETITVPATMDVCGRCGGHGTHDHAAFSTGITASEWAEHVHDDPDFPAEYARGTFAVTCEECHGANVVPAPDLDRLDDATRERVERWMDEEAAYRSEQAYVQRMGF